ncbi:MAG: peptidase T [Clostridia bacterium]|nr:peptidase T [Clostridia bacterium]
MNVKDIFFELVRRETTSDEESPRCPSTKNQLELAKLLVSRMRDIGIADAEVDSDGYVYGSIPATAKGYQTLGLIAHMDTAPGVSGKDIKPRVTEAYDGGDIMLNSDGDVLSPADYPSLLHHIGKRLVVTDGTTLLGADDKAGVAEILAVAERIINDSKPHGTVKIAFTPDEEIGRGADKFDVSRFGADYAYTVDGGRIGEIEYENFNAAAATVEIFGRNIHPGSARGKMKNAALRAMEFNSLLPAYEVPATTDGYEGFYHLTGMSGDESYAKLNYIIRDHDEKRYNERCELMMAAGRFFNQKYGENSARVTVSESYRNMKEKILPHMYIVERAKAAMLSAGVEPIIVPIRGGTDGARLSYMGLPCPNLSTGGENFHSRFEYIPLEDMERMVDVLEKIIYSAEEALV